MEEAVGFAEARAKRAEADRDVANLLRGQEMEDLRGALDDERRKRAELANRRSVKAAMRLSSIVRPALGVMRRLRPGSSAGTAPMPDGRAEGGKPPSGTLERLRNAPAVTVLIPIHNAAADVRRAVASVLANTPKDTSIVLIDDASTDPEVGVFLESLGGVPLVTVERNEDNLGFVATVNRGLREISGDVVVLNSDVVVGPRWLVNLRAAAYSADDVGSATAVSDNAGAFSVPEVGSNDLPAGLDVFETARLVMQESTRLRPETPTAHGFCMYLRRAMLDEVGYFDESAFPRGYGEENDLSMRAGRAGWRHIVDDSTYVHHVQAASFGSERGERIAEARVVIDERYPEYAGAVGSFMRGGMTGVRSHVASVFAAAREGAPKPRVMYVIHHGSGGTLLTNSDLMAAMGAHWDVFLMTSDRRTMRLLRVQAGELQTVAEHRLGRLLGIADTHDDEYEAVLGDWLIANSIELVHIRHLLKHTLDLPGICQTLGLPVVLSFHDYYFVCPTVHLLDESGVYCGGVCTAGDGVCPVPGDPPGTPHLKHDWVYTWRERVGAVFENVDVFVATTDSAREVYLAQFPELARAPFMTVEHGRDLTQHRLAAVPERGEQIRLVILGDLGPHKGPEFVRQLAELDGGRRIELHFLGSTPADLASFGVTHGRYDRESLPDHIAGIEPHFIGLFSTWAETYSHTLTEAWSMGVPVFASSLGALGERVSDHGGGWIVDVTDPEGAYGRIIAVADDDAEYLRQAARATAEDLPGVAEMAAQYADIYRSLLSRRSVADHR